MHLLSRKCRINDWMAACNPQQASCCLCASDSVGTASTIAASQICNQGIDSGTLSRDCVQEAFRHHCALVLDSALRTESAPARSVSKYVTLSETNIHFSHCEPEPGCQCWFVFSFHQCAPQKAFETAPQICTYPHSELCVGVSEEQTESAGAFCVFKIWTETIVP